MNDQNPKVTWTSDWPQDLGWYWFFGNPYSKQDRDPILSAVQVHQGANTLVYICGAAFMYKSEAVGVWAPMIVPPTPEEIHG